MINTRINPNSRLKLTKITLSANPDAKTQDSENGVKISETDKKGTVTSTTKINVMSDDREYYIAHFADPINIFAKHRTKVISQSKPGEWSGLSPEEIAPAIGKELPGEIITERVEAWKVDDMNPEEKEKEYNTLIVLGNERIDQVFGQAGHQIIDAEAYLGAVNEPAIAEPANNEMS